VPPAGPVGLPAQGEEAGDLLGGGDAVGGEELLHVGDLQADLGLLHPPDRGMGDVEGAARLLEAEARLFPKVLEALAEHHAQDGRSATRPRVHHVLSSNFLGS
jgi:hypothetical protein